MENLTIISMIVTAGLGVLSLYFGGKYKQAKKVLNNLVDMIEDDQVTEGELKAFLLSIKDLIHYV